MENHEETNSIQKRALQQHVQCGATVKTQLPKLQDAVKAIEQYRKEGKLTIAAALKGGQLSAYKREYGSESVGIQMMIWLQQLANAYAVGNTSLTEQEVSRIANEIMRDYWHMKLPEFAVFIDKAMRGDYGKVYNRLDGPTIHEWLRAYQEERAYEIEQINYSKKADVGYGPHLPANKQLENEANILGLFRKVQEDRVREKIKTEQQRNSEIDQEAADEKMRWYLINFLHMRYKSAMQPLLDIANVRNDRFGRMTTAAELIANRRFQAIMKLAKPAAQSMPSVYHAIEKFLIKRSEAEHRPDL